MNSLPPSFSNFNYTFVFQWILLIVILFFFYYAARKIKAEKSSFLEEAEHLSFKKLSLPIPFWWSQIKVVEQNTLKFQRSDTKYDWSCTIKEVAVKTTVLSYADHYLKENEIVLDNSYDSYEKTVRADYLFKNESTFEGVEDFIRYEATGTKNETDRIYLDLVCFRISGDKNIYHMESTSSILNGCVEGPFFEESLKNLIIS
mgnify:CR=1 FL=1